MNFTYDAYRNLIGSLKRHGYSFADYRNCDEYGRCVILRHDIDSSPDMALKMAELEADEGVKSTYFVLLTSEFYNVAARKNREMVLKIKELGHDIGLHFDELNYGNVPYDESDSERSDYERSDSVHTDSEHTDSGQNISPGGVLQNIRREAKLLSDILGIEIESVSMHRPSKMTLEADYDLSPLVNSYGKKFFRDYKYLSDSRRRWREDVDGIIESERYEKLHILTHAFWYHEKEESIEESVKNYVNSANAERYEIFRYNITDLKSVMPMDRIR